jgi:release factor glutamine methyltransferase
VIDLLKSPSRKTADSIPKPESDESNSAPAANVENKSGEGRGVDSKGGEAAQVRILDLGTGSGCIAISLAKHLPNAIITAVDRSPAALAVARQNAKSSGVEDRIEFLDSDWFSAFAGQPDRRWDIIVSNPPYISQAEYEKLPKSVKNFEPLGALVSGPEGTEDIAKLASEAPRYLSPQGYLLVEMSPMIASKVQAILNVPPWSYCRTIKDLAQHARIAVSRNSSTGT